MSPSSFPLSSPALTSVSILGSLLGSNEVDSGGEEEDDDERDGDSSDDGKLEAVTMTGGVLACAFGSILTHLLPQDLMKREYYLDI